MAAAKARSRRPSLQSMSSISKLIRSTFTSLGGLQRKEKRKGTGKNDVSVLIIHDRADRADADEIYGLLKPLFHGRLRLLDGSEEDVDTVIAEPWIAVILVSFSLEQHATQNKALTRASEVVPNNLLPVILDKELAKPNQMKGVLGAALASELYYDFSSEELAQSNLSYLMKDIERKANPNKPPGWDVFLSHEWGEGNKTHAIVRELADHIAKLSGLKVWFDEKEVYGPITAAMADGIDNSYVFVVIATERYMNKVNSGYRGDNCLREFRYGNAKRFDKTVVAALEVSMLQTHTHWSGAFQFALAEQTPVDISHIDETAIRKLIEAIEQRKNTSSPATLQARSPRMLDIWASLAPVDSRRWAKAKLDFYTNGTRSWIWDRVSSWFKTNDRMFVLQGDGGVGKSVVMAQLCKQGDALELRSNSNLNNSADEVTKPPGLIHIPVAAYHFFRHDSDVAREAKKALCSISWQLCKTIPKFADFIEPCFRPEFEKYSILDVFETLILNPAQKVSRQMKQVVVLDAIDECLDAEILLGDIILQHWVQSMPSWLCIVVSTRNIPQMELASFQSVTVVAMTLQSDENIRDIKLHINHVLSQSPGVIEPGDIRQSIDLLASRSEGLFLWTTFLPDALRAACNQKGRMLKLEDILEGDQFSGGLGPVFRQHFSRLLTSIGSDRNYHALLTLLVASREPLSKELLIDILKETEENPETILLSAQSFVSASVDGKFSLPHKLMAKWITNKEASGHLHVSKEAGHVALGEYCSSNENDFAHKHTLYHLVKGGLIEKAVQKLDNPAWVLGAILMEGHSLDARHQRLGLLTKDCLQLGLLEFSDTPKLLMKATGALHWNPEELASQILARTTSNEENPLRTKVSTVTPTQTWMRPLRRSLAHASDPLLRVLRNGSEGVNAVSIEGSMIASGSGDGTVTLWDLDTGELRHSLEGHRGSVRCITLTDIFVITGAGQDEELESSEDERSSTHSQSSLNDSTTWTPDNEDSLSDTQSTSSRGEDTECSVLDYSVRTWDARSGKALLTLQGHEKGVTCVAHMPGFVISGSEDKTVRVWNAIDGSEHLVFRKHKRAIVDITIRGTEVVSASKDLTVRIWNARTGLQSQRIKLQDLSDWVIDSLHSVCIINNSIYAATASGSSVTVWDVSFKIQLYEFDDFDDDVTTVAISDRYIVIGSDDQAIRVWDQFTGNELVHLQGHASYVQCVAISDQYVVSGSWDSTVRIWDVSRQSCKQNSNLPVPPHSKEVTCLTTFKTLVATASCDGSICIWDASNGALLHTLLGHSDQVNGLSFSSTSDLASVSDDKSLRLWNSKSGQTLRSLKGHRKKVTCVDFESDIVVSGSYDKTICIWCAASGDKVRTLKGHTKPITCVALELSQNLVASGSDDSTVWVWSLHTGQKRYQLLDNHGEIYCVGFASGGKCLVTVAWDCVVCVWDTITGEQMHSMLGHSEDEDVSELLVAENQQIFTRDTSGKVIGWDIETGLMLPRLKQLKSGFHCLITSLAEERRVPLPMAVGFTTDAEIITCHRLGDVIVVADDAGSVHFLHLNQPQK